MLGMSIRLLLGALLIVSAGAKLASAGESRRALAAFGFAGASAQAVGLTSLIGAEIAVAIAVIAGSAALAWLGVALMAMLTAALVGAIARGHAGEPCGCFGARSTIGWRGVARNVMLAGAFAVAALLPRDSLSTEQWLGIGIGASLLLGAALAVALLALAREIGVLRLRLGPAAALEIAGEGPEIGSRSSAIESFATVSGGDLALAVFASPGCRVCDGLRPSVETLADHPLLRVRTFEEGIDTEIWEQLDVPGSPYAVALGPDGVLLAKGTFNNLAQLESVIATAERRAERPLGVSGG